MLSHEVNQWQLHTKAAWPTTFARVCVPLHPRDDARRLADRPQANAHDLETIC
jgi:hypothetical protein